ncbi:MAG: S8 family serine peptidase [Chitinophagaceae bacterium]
MKTFFTLICRLLIFLLLPGMLFAQQKNDYSILLNSGNITPVENVNTLSKSSALFQNSLFGNKHYLTIQFYSLPDEAMKSKLKAAGITLEEYIPNMAYTATVPASMDVNNLKAFSIRSILQFSAAQKTRSEIVAGNYPSHAIKSFGTVDMTVVTYEKINAATIESSLKAIGAIIIVDNQVFRSFTIRVPQSSVNSLIGLSFVQWVEPISPPDKLENLPGRTLHRVNILQEGVRNLNGDGINMGIWDGGSINISHLDFSPPGRVTIERAGAVSDHATHVAGIMTGKGLVNPIAKGMAPNARLYNWDFNTDIQAEMAVQIPAKNLLVSNHSYGSTETPTCSLSTDPLLSYDARSRNTDINLNNFPSHLHVHSSGNAGGSCAGGFNTITGSGKSAKNNLVVSNVTTNEAIAGSSSRGPVRDGRIKPEISAMGTSVFSTWVPNNSYATASGTSMSTPGVAGTAALLYQRYKQLNADALPPSSLIKNIICNGAEDLGNPEPDYTYGFGRMNALAAVRILEENRYAINSITLGNANDVNITVPAGTVRLSVMLTWNDPAGAANADVALVNDLDLTVINGATTTLPWILDKINPALIATRGVDTYSNIEQVTIDNPVGGSYTLKVNGTSVAMGPTQQYSLTWIIEQQNIEIIYPNGGEKLSPGSNQVITWDNAGISANQTVEYSLNNGTNWTIISSSVPAITTRFTWNVPAANTSTALIRISSGAVTDISDATFNIIGTPSSLSVGSPGCDAGQVSFSWAAVTNATHYDIYMLNAATGVYVLIASDIAGTSFTVSGLTPGASLWFTHVAKNNTTGAVSERSNAVNAVVSIAGGGLGTLGAINGSNNICGATNDVPYNVATVAGATSYTWSAPPGAVVASGQGTSAITITYPAGSTNGNVSVFASNGICQTATVSLAIIVNSAGVAAPMTGGNQSQTVCAGAPTTTLSATATVPAGHTIIWYNAATGGTVVGSPTLNSTGTITYHAASRNTTTGCESATRTAVTLTIISVLPATINASGPTTFCQGGSVTLTANSGTSYLWSNGAVTQFIVVNTLGTNNYSVTVTNGTCSSISSPITVTVNSLPIATISASGPLAFCEPGSIILTASAGSSWLWSNGATTQAITVSTSAASGAYTVRVTNSNGCFTTSSATTVTVSPKPTITLTAAPYTKLFPGLTTTITATVTPPGSYTYTWMRGSNVLNSATGPSLPITFNELGSYSLTATNAGGCTNTSNVIVIGDSVTAKLFIMPNPNDGQFQVSYYSTPNSSFTMNIIDSKGAVVYSKFYNISTTYQRMDVDIRKHSAGIYTIVLIDKNGKRIVAGNVLIN